MAGLVDRLRGRVAGGLAEAEREALRGVLADPIFELLPLKSIADQIPALPPGARVSVTASPAKGIDATLDWAARLQADGFRAIPHLSARMIASRVVLAGLLDRARAAGLTHAFVVGGDADEPGAYLDGLSLLQAMAELGHPFTTLGCPGYPQGHPDIPDAALAQALRDKAPYVDHVTTQMDFSDYRDVNGVKMPFKTIITWTDGQNTIALNQIQPNVAINAAAFAMPKPFAKK